ncbi:MAG: hypothetical protein VW405_02870 [Rhodospirillaceae bacterium]
MAVIKTAPEEVFREHLSQAHIDKFGVVKRFQDYWFKPDTSYDVPDEKIPLIRGRGGKGGVAPWLIVAGVPDVEKVTFTTPPRRVFVDHGREPPYSEGGIVFEPMLEYTITKELHAKLPAWLYKPASEPVEPPEEPEAPVSTDPLPEPLEEAEGPEAAPEPQAAEPEAAPAKPQSRSARAKAAGAGRKPGRGRGKRKG